MSAPKLPPPRLIFFPLSANKRFFLHLHLPIIEAVCAYLPILAIQLVH